MSKHGELPAAYVRDLEEERPEERWLIEDLWGRAAVGVIGGSPKLGKSWLGLDFAVSVASATPALDRYKVADPGTTLVYLAEDARAQVRARIASICRHRGLGLDALDVVAITADTLRLDTERDQERLRRTLDRFRPRLVLLDPLVRLHALDENSSLEIARLLGYFRELQRSFDCAVILVHHASKKQRSRPGQSLRGSSDLHAFGDSNACLAARGDRVALTLEHRSARAPEPIALELVVTDSGQETTHLRVCDYHDTTADHAPPLETRILELLRGAGALKRTELRSQLRVNNHRLGEALAQLENRGVLRRDAGGWSRSSDSQ